MDYFTRKWKGSCLFTIAERMKTPRKKRKKRTPKPRLFLVNKKKFSSLRKRKSMINM